MFDWLFDLISTALNNGLMGFVFNIIWMLLIGPLLMLLEAFEQLFIYLSGDLVMQVLFGIGTLKNPADPNGGVSNTFVWGNIPTVFWAFLLFSFLLMGIMWCVNYWSIVVSDDMDVKQRIVKASKSSLIAFATAVLMPIGIFLLSAFSIMIIEVLLLVLTGGSGINNPNKASPIAGLLYHIGSPNWDGIVVVGSGTALWKPPTGLISGNYNLLITVAATCGMFYGMAVGLVSLAMKTFEIFWLFIKGPVIAATTVIDDGARLKIWKESILNKFMAMAVGLSTYLASILVLNLIIKIKPSQITGGSKFLDTAFLLIMIWAAAAFIMLGPSLASKFTGGESAIDKSAMDATKGIIKASGVGMMAAGAIGARAAGSYGGFNKMKPWGKGSGLKGRSAGMGGSDQLGESVLKDEDGNVTGFAKTNMFGAWKNRFSMGKKAAMGVAVVGAAVGTGAAAIFGNKAAKARVAGGKEKFKKAAHQKFADTKVGTKFDADGNKIKGHGESGYKGDYETQYNDTIQRLKSGKTFTNDKNLEEGSAEYNKAHKKWTKQRKQDIKFMKANPKQKANAKDTKITNHMKNKNAEQNRQQSKFEKKNKKQSDRNKKREDKINKKVDKSRFKSSFKKSKK
ncbi:Mbov_0396 family ICE element transmembrane protein [Williamsoniiplasma lucivorax]|uniref:Uncharacterized protein n=1 Tax=Williamsoniiplasma lucivorax TaxID=209274 RepID=A0A2S5R942_9MOLU|nr:hypothetical protein [Williamsoniiplasma lucivorax]PPE03820.1 hypothetical protein ELUCI_v1c09650 [Williamsoniiplasma lucivorax]